MRRDFFTDEQVEVEISRLSQSDAVRLAKKEQNIKYRRRQQMYSLRVLEKRGEQLLVDGITLENIEERLFGEAANELTS